MTAVATLVLQRQSGVDAKLSPPPLSPSLFHSPSLPPSLLLLSPAWSCDCSGHTGTSATERSGRQNSLSLPPSFTPLLSHPLFSPSPSHLLGDMTAVATLVLQRQGGVDAKNSPLSLSLSLPPSFTPLLSHPLCSPCHLLGDMTAVATLVLQRQSGVDAKNSLSLPPSFTPLLSPPPPLTCLEL